MLYLGGWKMKCLKCCLFMVLLGVILTGCREKAAVPLRVVTHVDVAYDRGYQILRRQYTKPEKVSMVLNYLRLQKDMGDPNVDPEMVLGDRMQIDVVMSDGTHRYYYQQSGHFLCEKNEKWHMIDPKLSENFDFYLQMIPTDRKPLPEGRGEYL